MRFEIRIHSGEGLGMGWSLAKVQMALIQSVYVHLANASQPLTTPK